MHKLPIIVFKTLGLSLVLMFLLDTTLVAVDTVNVNSKVTNIAGIIQNEIARHNSIMDSSRELFENQLDDVIDRSMVATNYTTNMATELSSATPHEYGDIATLNINVNMTPTRVYFASGEGADERGDFLLKDSYNYTLNYTYQVPCLRYLK